MKMEQSVPKRRHIKFRRRGITQRKTYNIQNTAKVWNQEYGLFISHNTTRFYTFYLTFNVYGSVHRDNLFMWFQLEALVTQPFFLNLITALHVSRVVTTHPQEHKATASTGSGKHYTVLLSATIVEELELIWVCCRWRVDKHATYNTPKSVPTFPR